MRQPWQLLYCARYRPFPRDCDEARAGSTPPTDSEATPYQSPVDSVIGGAARLWGSVMLLEWLSEWQPFPEFPLNVPVTPDNHVYGVALLLAIVSRFLFSAAPSTTESSSPGQDPRWSGGLSSATFCRECRLPFVQCW